MHSTKSDRARFLGRLTHSPRFALAHAPDLARTVARALTTRARLRLLGDEHGAKRSPPWLGGLPALNASRSSAGGFRLPIFPALNHETFASDASIVSPPVGDPERKLAEHRWPELTTALWATADQGAAAVAAALRWIDAHRVHQGAAWETYSACERVANLLAYLATADRAVSAGVEEPLRAFVAESLSWIASHLEYYGRVSTNNHLLNNGRALVMGGVASADDAAVVRGVRILREALPRMIMPGGFLRERSSHYQLVVLNWVLDAEAFATLALGAGDRDVASLRETGERMANAAALIVDESGRLAACVGDVSPDATPATSAARLRRLYPHRWPPPASDARQIDGWFRLARDGSEVIGNFPPGAFPPAFPTHGHADYTSAVWRRTGHELLGDSGRASYGDDAVSAFQRSALGHSVLLVDGYSPVSDPLVAGGAWWARPYANAALSLRVGDDEVRLEHDGFARATPVRKHARSLRPAANALVVRDELAGEGEACITLCWTFGDGVTSFDQATQTANGPAGTLRLRVEGAGAPALAWLSDDAPGAWRSPTYGVVSPAVGIRYESRVSLPCTITTRFELTPCVASPA